MGDASKLWFAFVGDYREGMIAFLCLFDLFECPLIIPISCNGFQHGGITSPIRAKIMINPEFMRITVVSNNFLGIIV